MILPLKKVRNSEACTRVRRWLEEGKTVQEASQLLVEYALKVTTAMHKGGGLNINLIPHSLRAVLRARGTTLFKILRYEVGCLSLTGLLLLPF